MELHIKTEGSSYLKKTGKDQLNCKGFKRKEMMQITADINKTADRKSV